MSKLHIAKPRLNANKILAKISSELGAKTELYFEVEERFKRFLCAERADAFVVAVLPYAIKHELDIAVDDDAPVSSQLYYQLTTYLVPMMCRAFGKREIKIDVKVDGGALKCGGAVGTGISCGVDSLYTLLKHSNKLNDKYNITHLTFFNAGSNGDYGGTEARKLYDERKEVARKFCAKNQYEFVCVDTNISEFLLMNFEKTHTFRSLACVLALQKLFGKYYYSSGLGFDGSRIDEYDTAFYDILNMQMLSTECLSFYSTGIETSRLEKCRFIADSKIAQENLDVCVAGNRNCSRCEKCIRTMLELDALNKLHLYAKVFDVQLFRKKRFSYIIHMFRGTRTKTGELYRETYGEYRKYGRRFLLPRLLSYTPNTATLKNAFKKIFPKTYGNLKRRREPGCVDDGWA